MPSFESIRAWLGRRARAKREQVLAHPIAFALTALVMLLGLFLRARGYLFQRHGFWLDEAAWAVLLMKKPLVTLLIRPIGFMSLSKLLALALGPSEVVLRGISWIAGLLTLLLAPALSRRLYQAPMARLLFVAVLALHPAAIDLSKEFKPYSASLCGHLVVLFCVLRYVETQGAKDLVLALVAAFVANMFSQDLVMAYPGMFLVLGWDTLTRRRGRLPWVVAAALGLVLALGAQYWFIWRHIQSDAPSYWGHKYNDFYVEDSAQGHLRWWFGRYGELAELPALRHKFWVSEPLVKQLATVDTVLWWLIHAAGLLTLLVRRRFREATLLCMPLVTITLMNSLGQWPFGPFRANLFLLAYEVAIAGMAFDWRLAAPLRWLDAAPAVVLVLVPLCAFDREWNARKRVMCADSDLAKVVKALVEKEPEPSRRQRTLLFLSGRVCSPYEYYSSVNPRTSERFHQALRQRFEVRCTRTAQDVDTALARSVPAAGHAWLVTDFTGSELAGIQKRLRKKVSFEPRFATQPHTLYELTRVP
jgi:hypothetical protein